MKILFHYSPTFPFMKPKTLKSFPKNFSHQNEVYHMPSKGKKKMRQEKRKKKGEERAKLLSLLTPQNICKILLSAHARTSQANRELKQRRFWATHVNRKSGSLPFYMPRHWQICIAKCLFSYKENLIESFNRTTAQWCKKSTSGWRPLLKNAVA